ncbi:MAG: hypothetical protein ACIAQF_08520, partial [Phycisphaerales bacterium JB065]
LKPIRSAWRAALIVCLVSAPTAIAGDCEPQWNHGIAGSGPVLPIPGSSGVTTSFIYDDGTGPALYIGGDFPSFNGIAGTQGIARWDGEHWSSVGGGMAPGGRVEAFAVYDDGTGPALYVGGTFTDAGGVANTSTIAKWDGANWSPAQTVASLNGTVYDLEVATLDEAEGPRLYAGGYLSGTTAVSKLNLSTGVWQTVGGTNNGGYVLDLQQYTENGNPYLYAAGSFTTMNNSSGSNIARYNGTAWNTGGTGTNQFGVVHKMHVHNDGTGPSLYAGGLFTTIGGIPASKIAKRTPTGWQSLAGGIGGPQPCPTCQVVCWAMATFDDGTGPALYVAGNFSQVDGQSIYRFAKWDGATWSAVGTGPGGPGQEPAPVIRDMIAFNGCGGLAPGAPEALFMVGKFDLMNGVDNRSVAQLSACSGGLLGDLNGNGTVDLPDLNLVLANFGQNTSAGDINGDCMVNLVDLNLLLANFGNFEG